MNLHQLAIELQNIMPEEEGQVRELCLEFEHRICQAILAQDGKTTKESLWLHHNTKYGWQITDSDGEVYHTFPKEDSSPSNNSSARNQRLNMLRLLKKQPLAKYFGSALNIRITDMAGNVIMPDTELSGEGIAKHDLEQKLRFILADDLTFTAQNMEAELKKIQEELK